MSIRPVKKIIESKPTMEGAGVHLRRAFGFGETKRVRSVPAAGRFPQRQSRRVQGRLSLASASRHRDDHLRPGRRGRSRRQPGQQGRARRGRRAVDDGGQRHHASGDAARRRAGPHARLPALGQPAARAEDDGAALPGHQGRRRARGDRRRRHQGARGDRRLLGQEGPGRGCRRRSALSRHLGAARQEEDLQGRGRPPRLRLYLRGLRRVRLGDRRRSAC